MDKEKLLKTVIETVEKTIKPSINSVAERLDDNSQYLEEIKAQLDRIEQKIDFLLSSQTFNKKWISSKKKTASA